MRWSRICNGWMASVLSLLSAQGIVVFWSFSISLSAVFCLGPVFLWRSYSSRSWFCLVRHSTTVAKVCTYLSRAVVHGSPSWLLLVVIERVSTIQLFMWEVVIWLLLSFPQTAPTDDAKNLQWVSQSSRTLWQNLRNKNTEDFTMSTSVVLAKYPSKVKLEKENFYNSRVPELGKLHVPWFMRALGFL